MMIVVAARAFVVDIVAVAVDTKCQWNHENKQANKHFTSLHFVAIESSSYCLNYFLFSMRSSRVKLKVSDVLENLQQQHQQLIVNTTIESREKK